MQLGNKTGKRGGCLGRPPSRLQLILVLPLSATTIRLSGISALRKLFHSFADVLAFDNVGYFIRRFWSHTKWLSMAIVLRYKNERNGMMESSHCRSGSGTGVFIPRSWMEWNCRKVEFPGTGLEWNMCAHLVTLLSSAICIPGEPVFYEEWPYSSGP